jgi:hypothetical protein
MDSTLQNFPARSGNGGRQRRAALGIDLGGAGRRSSSRANDPMKTHGERLSCTRPRS